MEGEIEMEANKEDALSALKAACASKQPKSASELIRVGNTRWLGGRPTSAPPGTIALAQNGPFKVIIREEDVKSVKKHEGLYLVEVSADANILISLEKVVKANLSGCGCGPKPQTTAEKAEKADSKASGDAGVTLEIDCVIVETCKVIEGVRVCFIESVSCSSWD